MAWQSPYHDEPTWLSPRARNVISRLVMFALGVGLAVTCMRMTLAIRDAYAHATTQPVVRTSVFGRGYSAGYTPLYAGGLTVGIGLLGGSLIAASVLPVGVMQSLFERWNRPPVTGDRSGPIDEAGWVRRIFRDVWWP